MKKGPFELVDGGTLFLDEMASCHRYCRQSCCAYWRIRSSGELAAWATCRSMSGSRPPPIATWLKENVFRQNLYYRLAIISIFLPPLRAR